MRASTLLLLFAATCLGCSKSGADDDDDAHTSKPPRSSPLTTGSYRISGAVVETDGCFVMDGLDGEIDDVAVEGDEITYRIASGTIADGVFEATAQRPLDLSTDPFGAGAIDCLLHRTFFYDGTTTAANEADVGYTFLLDGGVGTECDRAAEIISEVVGNPVTTPCASIASYHIAQLPPLVGALSLVATNGQLTMSGVMSTSSGFTMSGTFDAGGAFSEASHRWICYAPDLPNFPNFDLYIGGPEYFLTLGIAPADWVVGSVAVEALPDATLRGPTSRAVLTGGSLEILAAPLTLDSAHRCAVRLNDVPFSDAVTSSPPPESGASSGDAPRRRGR